MKPKICILTTGGTIAGAAARSDALTVYRAGALGAGELLAAVPEIADVGAIESDEVAAIDSKDMTEAVWLHLADRIEAALAAGAAGIVHAGTGNGSIHEALLATLADAAGKGIPVVRASRTGAGAVLFAESAYADAGFIDADTLPPAKARILLALALLKTNDRNEIRRMFREY